MRPASRISYQTVHHLYSTEWSKNNVYLFIRLWFHYSARFVGTVEIPVHFPPRSSDLQTRLTAKWTLKPTDTASVINHLLAVSLMSMSLHHAAAHTTLTEHTCIYHAVRARVFFFFVVVFLQRVPWRDNEANMLCEVIMEVSHSTQLFCVGMRLNR